MCHNEPRERIAITDAELVARALQGSPAAYRELVRRFERPLLSVIVRMVRDPVLAEDLAQETFVKAFHNLRHYDPSRKLASWLFKIAHNTTIDYLRRKHPDTVPLEASPGDAQDTWEVLQAPEDQAPDRILSRRELAGGIAAALSRLKPQYREVLLLRFQEELSYQEIADVTGLAMGTVKIHLHRARKQLAAALQTAGFAPPGRWLDEDEREAKQEGETARRVPREDERT